MSKPNEIITDNIAVPPYDISGSGTPTTGIRPVIIEALENTYKKKFKETPTDKILPKT